MSTKAETILGPLQSDELRAAFLYVGQGEATLLLIPNGEAGHTSMLIDCNRGESLGGIDLAALLKDLLPTTGGADKPRLDYFVNTHPHKDHLGGLAQIREALDIRAVWHSGHRPGKDHDGPYNELKSLIKQLEKDGGEVVELTGSRSPTSIGDAEFYILAPAQHVTDDIEGDDGEARYQRIHEQCAVLRIGYGPADDRVRILISGDSDKVAWKEHLAYHHKDEADNRVQSDILSASHHGSRTFFKTSEADEEPYTDALEAIGPTYLIISAPDRRDSPHGHPHEDALDLYGKVITDKRNILLMGSRKLSFVADISADGQLDLRADGGELAEAYGLTNDKGGPGGGGKKSAVVMPGISRVEHTHPMGKGPQ